MGIIAWIVLGLGAGLLANMLIPGRRSQGLILTCVIGVLGALGGGWAATRLFHVHTLNGFFNLSTWLTAIAGAAVLLLDLPPGQRPVRRFPPIHPFPPVRAPLSTASTALRQTACTHVHPVAPDRVTRDRELIGQRERPAYVSR